MQVEEYRALQARRPRRRAQPERTLQQRVVARLVELDRLEHLHCFDWTASLAGVRLTAGVRAQMKRAGLRAGWPDLQFACWDGLTRYVELKADGGSLSAEQRHFRNWAEPHGLWALCRSIDEVIAALTAWDVVRRQGEAA